METYIIIFNSLVQIYSGKNLTEVLGASKTHPQNAKIKSLCYGVIRKNFELNYLIHKLCTNLDLNKYIILRLGIYEILYSNKKPYAIVNDLVKLSAKQFKNPKVKDFINAVLRNFLRQQPKLNLEFPTDSIKYNLPQWILDKLNVQYGKEAKKIIEGLNHHPALGLRLSNKIKLEQYQDLLNQRNQSYAIYEDKIILTKPCPVDEIPGFGEGLVSIQDIAAQESITILKKNLVSFTTVLDACAAPGGKACQILENYAVKLTALEINLQRLEKIKQNLQRLNLSAKLIAGDAAQSDWWNRERFDLIIADVPCSATGTIKRNPDIKINRLASDIVKFQLEQQKIILNLWPMLNQGGFLLYITCSIFREENQDNLMWFKNNLPNVNLVDELQIFPTYFQDSLYYALVQKI
jgi:16S rRNA (cytosine967-C5)-methyltransferase